MLDEHEVGIKIAHVSQERIGLSRASIPKNNIVITKPIKGNNIDIIELLNTHDNFAPRFLAIVLTVSSDKGRLELDSQ